MTVRTRFIMLLLCTVVATIVMVSFLTYQVSAPFLRSSIEEVQQEKAREALVSIENFLSHHKVRAQDLSEHLYRLLSIHGGMHQQEIEYPLEHFLNTDPLYRETSLVRQDGREIYRVSRHTFYTPADMRDFASDRYAAQVKATKQSLYRDIRQNEFGEPVIQLYSPVLTAGKDVSHLLIVSINLKPLWDILSNIRHGKTGYALVIDRKGHIVAHPDLSVVLSRTDLSGSPLFQRLQEFYQNPKRSGELVNGVQGDYSFSAGIVEEAGWFVAVRQEISEARKPLYFIAGSSVVGMMLILVSVSALAVFFGRRMTAPLQMLAEGVKTVASGRLDHSVVVQSKDEIGELASGFNQMAASLKATMVSKEYMDSIVRSMINTLIVTSSSGEVELVNEAACSLLGYREEELLGMQLSQIIATGQGKVSGLSSKEIFAAETVHNQEMGYRRKDGRAVKVLFSSSMLHGAQGEIHGFVCVAQDISKLKEVEEELRQSGEELERSNQQLAANRQSLQKALDEISTLIHAVIDQKDIGVRFENPNLRKCNEIRSCTSVDCSYYNAEATRCWKIAREVSGGQDRCGCADQEGSCSQCPVYLAATSDPIYEIGEHFNNMMDIVEMVNRELEKTQAQMLQNEKMASIGQLAAGVAHEINNPTGFVLSNLASLVKYADKLTEYISILSAALDKSGEPLLQEELHAKRKQLKIDYVVEDIKDLLAESIDGAERIKRIVQNMKGFSRLDESEFKPADINECIETTLNIVWNELKYKARVHKDLADLPSLECYPMQLNQVFMNLLVNAGQALEGEGDIHIRSWNGDGFIKVAISDSGTGIPAEVLGRIFEPFYTTKEVGKGTGLGLSISYDIVKKHGGELLVESEIGQGTTFTVTLPVQHG